MAKTGRLRNFTSLLMQSKKYIFRRKFMMGIFALMCIMASLFIFFSSGDIYSMQHDTTFKSSKIWTWSCQQQHCVRSKWVAGAPWGSLSECHMTCGPSLAIWPKPSGETSHAGNVSSFLLARVACYTNLPAGSSLDAMFSEAFDIFKLNLEASSPAGGVVTPYIDDQVSLTVDVYFEEAADTVHLLDTDDGYSLKVVMVNATAVIAAIRAKNFFGARNALETLSQLIWWDTDGQTIGQFKILNTVSIEDKPKFAYRGVMIDAARTFMSIDALERTIRGMGASKLNVLHLHLTDSQSFSFKSKRYPQMARFGAIGPDKVYTRNELKCLTRYARIRGVRLLPEMDAPSHTSVGWQWGEDHDLGPLAVCINQQPWREYCGSPPCGQLNPNNNNTYRVLRGLYKDLIEMTEPTDTFHIGGDEVNKNCWLSTPGVIELAENQTEREAFNSKLAEFHRRQLLSLQLANLGRSFKNVIVWSVDELDGKVLLDTYPRDKYVIQEWGSSEWENTAIHLEMNYRVILSHVNAWYLDCGYGGDRQACAPVASWQTVYKHRPWDGYATHRRGQILGGEVCLWTEFVIEAVLDSRVWPRAAALAERLWTDPLEGLGPDAALRLAIHRERLIARGLQPDAMQPQWCFENPGVCL